MMQDQTSENFAVFALLLPSLLPTHRGKYALLHSGELIDCFLDSLAAITTGYTRFGEGCFSVELIDDMPEDLGFFSHVSSALHA